MSGDSYLARDGYKFSHFYGMVASTLSTAEGLFGRDTVDRVFAAYFDPWAFRHPRFEDFLTLRSEIDPGGVFLNAHLRRILGVGV